jgi:hypothetical protein
MTNIGITEQVQNFWMQQSGVPRSSRRAKGEGQKHPMQSAVTKRREPDKLQLSLHSVQKGIAWRV